METLLPIVFNVATAGVCISLGVVVLARNPRKSTHQAFAALAFNFGLWALGVASVIQSGSTEEARTWIIITEIVSCFIPSACYLFTCYFPSGRFEGSKPVLVALLGSSLVFATLAPTPLYVNEVTYSPGHPPKLVHGPAMLGVLTAMIFAIVAVHTNLRRKIGLTEGQERRQTQFVLLGIYAVAGFGFFISIVSAVLKIPLFQAYGPISTGLVMGIFAYAMIRFHLLDTRILVTRAIVAIVTTGFVMVSVAVFTVFVEIMLGEPLTLDHLVPSLLAGFFISIFFVRVSERTTAVVEGSLFRKRYDINRLYRRIAEEASEEVQLSQMLRTVADHIQSTIGVRGIRVFLIDPDSPNTLAPVFSSFPGDPKHSLRDHGPLLTHLRRHPHPLLLEKILHSRPTEAMIKVAEHLANLDAYFCLPLRTSGGLVGIITLGQKLNGDAYSEEELTAFHALGGPLGIAIANAQLYEALESVNLHLSRVLGQMREGVVAVDSKGTITTINEAARRFFGPLTPGHSLDALTPEAADVLRTALREERTISDLETALPGPDGKMVPVVMSSSVMMAPGHGSTGAVALIYDLSQIKLLEQNVLRADRLSSLGVLAAGMAHEIKNPLVSIKTFSQLLLKRYQDPDFRATFEETVPGEVDRINAIVSRLLEFAKPRPVNLQPQLLPRIITEVLTLVENQTRKAKVKVSTHFPEEDVLVYGDEQQLHQVFLNLILNALHAMNEDEEEIADSSGWRGYLDISVELGHARLRERGMRAVRERQCVRIKIADTGCGIPEEHLQNLFTPFFTTKEQGSGLGLSVVHGIVSEHGGDIDVASRVGEGTTFTVTLASVEPARADAEIHPVEV